MSKLLTILLFLVGLALVSGCDDDKAQVAEASRQLVEADAKSRTEIVALQRDLQQGQTELGRQRDQLEDDRRRFADQRNRDPIIANTLTTVGTTIACLLPLVLGIYLARGLRDPSQVDSTLTEILIEEIATNKPVLLPPPGSWTALKHEMDSAAGKPEGAE
jgi:hypothetical protein